jgi:hypothetical protein
MNRTSVQSKYEIFQKRTNRKSKDITVLAEKWFQERMETKSQPEKPEQTEQPEKTKKIEIKKTELSKPTCYTCSNICDDKTEEKKKWFNRCPSCNKAININIMDDYEGSSELNLPLFNDFYYNEPQKDVCQFHYNCNEECLRPDKLYKTLIEARQREINLDEFSTWMLNDGCYNPIITQGEIDYIYNNDMTFYEYNMNKLQDLIYQYSLQNLYYGLM